ncbi:MAG: hypothetical protein ABSC36_00075 [Gaiellaceae bacterium]
MSVLLRDEFERHELTASVQLERVRPLLPVNELVERFVGALDFFAEDGVAVHLSLGCDRWTAVTADRTLIEGLLLGLSMRARDHMRQGGLLSLETSLTKLDESDLKETGLPPGEYVRVSVSDTGGWSDDALNSWTTRVGSLQRLERPSLAALRHVAEIAGGALVCARHACCGERANLYLPATRRHMRSVLPLS